MADELPQQNPWCYERGTGISTGCEALLAAEAEVERLRGYEEDAARHWRDLCDLREAALDVVERYRGLANDANDGEFALWFETDLVNAIVALDTALSSPAGGDSDA
jgi:predicted metal-dependent HD superfamily phosphohydrolase